MLFICKAYAKRRHTHSHTITIYFTIAQELWATDEKNKIYINFMFELILNGVFESYNNIDCDLFSIHFFYSVRMVVVGVPTCL